MDHAQIKAVCNKYNCIFEENFPLAGKTSIKIGGKCDLYVEANSEECLAELLKVCRENALPYFILGKGSNLLIRRFRGVVIAIGSALGGITVKGNTVTSGAGAALSAVCCAALENSLSGMECLYGIPGSMGGALYMNAGAYGGEIKDIVTSARCIDANGNIVEITADKMELSYRHSVFAENGCCILSATLELIPREKAEIKARMDELMQKRRDKQPLEFPSCGSTFKRPDGYFAAALIEECGLKGCTVGGAQVSEKHSGFVINRGGATFEDVMELVEHIKTVVLGQKGVELECEMLIVDK